MKLLSTPIIRLMSSLSILLIACNSEVNNRAESVSIDLDKTDKVSFYDIYESIEVIPLETRQESLLTYRYTFPNKLIVHDGKYYILDQDVVFIFNGNGEYVDKIDRRGRGRGEYTNLSDVIINQFTGNIELLSATGYINVYDLNTLEFKYKISLNSGVKAIHNFEALNKDTYVLYSKYNDGDQILLYSMEQNKVIRGAYDMPIWLSNTGLMGSTSPLYMQDSTVCFAQTYDGRIFNISPTKPILTERYSWDFGDATMYLKYIPKDKDLAYYSKYLKVINDKYATYFISYLENDKLFMNCFKYRSKWYQAIYKKDCDDYILYSKFDEGIVVLPQVIDDQHAYSSNIYSYTTERTVRADMLDEENLAKYKTLKESNNPAIIKYKFK